MHIVVQTHQGIPHTFCVNEGSSVKDLKILIKGFFGLDWDEQKLIYKNEPLNDSKELREYGIIDECVVKLLINIKREMFTCSVEMQDGLKFNVQVRSTDTLTEIKRKIKGHCSLYPDQQILVHQGRILEGNEIISSFGVQDQSVIYVIQRLVNVLEIYAKTMDQNQVVIDVTKSFTIFDVKTKIEEKLKIASDEQRIVYKGRILKDEETVEKISIAEYDVITVVVRIRKKTIFAQVSGKWISLVIKENDKIIDIKKMIHEKIGFPPDLQRITYNGIILDDDKRADYYEIEKDSHIFVDCIMRHCAMRIFVKTTEGNTIELKLVEGDKIIDIKKKIEDKIGLSPDEHDLLYDGCVLDDNETVGCRMVNDNMALHIQKKSPPPKCSLL